MSLCSTLREDEMRPIFLLKNFIRFTLVCSLIICFYSTPSRNIVFALSINNTNTEMVVEELRLNVPQEYKSVWLKAEREIWEPWLSKQKGYLGRDIFYNENKAEGLVLVKWENKKLWKNIESEEVSRVQLNFEDNVTRSLELKKNPFELVYEGELLRENEY